MPCYNSLAADRHADEQGQLDRLDQFIENQKTTQLYEFVYHAEPIDGLDTDEFLTDIWSSVRLFELIEQAWRSGNYYQLAGNIEHLIHERAKQFLDDQRIQTPTH